jgi:hypothetical protein
VFFEDTDDLHFTKPRLLHGGLLRGQRPQDSPPIFGSLHGMHVREDPGASSGPPGRRGLTPIAEASDLRRYAFEMELSSIGDTPICSPRQVVRVVVPGSGLCALS